MAPKRSAPPPPPGSSSEEEASGSGSDESEDEEEIVQSQPQPTAAPKQKGQEPEASDEDEDEEEEEEQEEEDERANNVTPHSATRNPPPPNREESEASDKDEDEEEDEEEDERNKHVAPTSATKNPPPPNREESETSDEEENEEADDEMHRPKTTPNQEAEGKGAKPSPPIQDKRPSAMFKRIGSPDDEVRILEAMAAHRLEHGTLPRTNELAAALVGSLSHSELERKVKSLRSRYSTASRKGELPSKDHSLRLFNLSKSVWGPVTVSRAAAKSVVQREVSEMYKLYPYLAEEVRALEKVHPGLFKREFGMVDDGKARALDTKIKKMRREQIKIHQRHHDLIKEVTKTLIDLDNQGK